MMIITALVMAGQEYSPEQGWIISGAHGELMSAPSSRGAYYYARDPAGAIIIGAPRLEEVLAGLLEREPAGILDEHWKIEQCERKQHP